MSFQELIEKERAQRREFILDNAERLFYEKGFDSVTMEDLATAIGFNKATIYIYFKNKDSIFLNIVFRKWREFGHFLADCAQGGATGGEKIRIMIRCYIDFARKNREYNEFATTYGPMVFRRMDEEDQRTIRDIAGRYIPLLYGAIDEGQADGSIRGDIDRLHLGFLINMLTFNVVSPDPSWKASFAMTGGSYEDLFETFLVFIEPAITGCPEAGRAGEKKTPSRKDAAPGPEKKATKEKKNAADKPAKARPDS